MYFDGKQVAYFHVTIWAIHAIKAVCWWPFVVWTSNLGMALTWCAAGMTLEPIPRCRDFLLVCLALTHNFDTPSSVSPNYNGLFTIYPLYYHGLFTIYPPIIKAFKHLFTISDGCHRTVEAEGADWRHAIGDPWGCLNWRSWAEEISGGLSGVYATSINWDWSKTQM
jgi:hypothetical protein